MSKKNKSKNEIEDNSYMFIDEDKVGKKPDIKPDIKDNSNKKDEISDLKITITSIGIAACLGIAIGASTTIIRENNHKVKSSYNTYPAIGQYDKEEKEKMIFQPGEHIVSVPIAINNDIRKHVYRFPSHNGYEPIKIFVTAAGNDNLFAGGYIIYQNTETVKCTSNKVSDEHDSSGDYIYDKFGTPVYDKEDNKYDIKKGEFDVGCHIISVPIGEYQFDIDNFNKNKEHEGYTLVDVCGTLYGDDSSFGGAVALYKNNVPIITNKVNPKYNSFKNYEEFGYPIEKDKTKTLK